jgi:CheY-like chemotaxis protein
LLVTAKSRAANRFVRTLRLWGHPARTAASSSAALLLMASRQHPQVFLIDLDCPLEDRQGLPDQLRSVAPGRSPFIVALAGPADHGRRESSAMEGYDLFLPKPVNGEVLKVLLALECQLNHRRDKKENRSSVGLPANQVSPVIVMTSTPPLPRMVGA